MCEVRQDLSHCVTPLNIMLHRKLKCFSFLSQTVIADGRDVCNFWRFGWYIFRLDRKGPKHWMSPDRFDHPNATTISRWFKAAMMRAGLDMSVFTAHSVSSAGISAADRAKVSLQTILNTAE